MITVEAMVESDQAAISVQAGQELNTAKSLADCLLDFETESALSACLEAKLERSSCESELRLGFETSLENLQTDRAADLQKLQLYSRHKLAGLREILALRKAHLKRKDELRELFRSIAAFELALAWQSPPYLSTLSRLSDSRIKEHVLDYKRDGHLEGMAYEADFLQEYTRHLGAENLHAFLSNSGMAAFSTALHWIFDEGAFSGSVMACLPMYFENLHLLSKRAPQLERLDPASTTEALQEIARVRPKLLCLDSASNSGRSMQFDVEAVIKQFFSVAEEGSVLLLDATCEPCARLSPGLFSEKPEHVRVIVVESLAKYHQYGMDLVTAGILLVTATEEEARGFNRARARFGTMLSDYSVLCLPSPSRELLLARLRRASRNAEIVQAKVQEKNFRAHALGRVRANKEVDSNAFTDLLLLEIPEERRSVDFFKQIEAEIFEAAKKAGIPLSLSTSFGFDDTRLYVTAPATAFEPPFLRVALGQETEIEAVQLGNLIFEVCERMLREEIPANVQRHSNARVFLGEKGLENYLSPDNFGPTPLVELPRALNPYRDKGYRIFAKLAHFVPLLNIKSYPAYSMLEDAAQNGKLVGVNKVVESSSSNTILSLSVLARLRGITDITAVVDDTISPPLKRMLQLFGIEVCLHPGPKHPLHGKVPPRSAYAKCLGAQAGCFNACQYENPANPRAFSRWMGPELVQQTEGRLNMLSGSYGTCGTLVGLSGYLKQELSDFTCIGCMPKRGDSVPGPREERLLNDVGFDWSAASDAKVHVSAKDSYAASVQLLRHGVLGGPSSGLNYAGLMQVLEKMPAVEDEIWTAFLCCDSPFQHIDEYFDVLDEGAAFAQVLPCQDDAESYASH